MAAALRGALSKRKAAADPSSASASTAKKRRADTSLFSVPGDIEIPESYADIKCHFVQDVWDALPDDHKDLRSLYALLVSAKKMQRSDESMSDAVASFLRAFNAREPAGKIDTISTAFSRKNDRPAYEISMQMKHFTDLSRECLKDFEAFAEAIPHRISANTPDARRRACLLALAALCFPVLPFQADVKSVLSRANQVNSGGISLKDAPGIDICMARLKKSPKELLQPASMTDLIQLIVELRDELNSSNHKSCLLMWRKLKHPQSIDDALAAAAKEYRSLAKTYYKQLPVFTANFPCFAILNKELSDKALFDPSTADKVGSDFAAFLGVPDTDKTNIRPFQSILNAFAQTTAIQDYISSTSEDLVKTEDEPDTVLNPVVDVEEHPNAFQTNIGKGAIVPTLTLADDADMWTESTRHRPVGGTWEIEIRDRYPSHIDIERMFSGFPVKDDEHAWQVAGDYAADNDNYAVHPNVVIGDVTISSDGLDVLKSWVKYHGITTPLETLKKQWISQIKAEYEAPMKGRKPPSAQAWQVVRMERRHCYSDAQFEALKGKYGVIPVEGVKQALLNMGPAFAGVSITSDEERSQYIARYGQQQFDDYAIECIAPDDQEKTVHVVPYGSPGGFFNGKLTEDDPCHFIAIDVFVEMTDKRGNKKWQSRPHLVLVNEVAPNKQALMNYLGNYFTARSAPAIDDSSSGSRLIKTEPQDE